MQKNKPIYCWVYQDNQPSQLTVWYIRLNTVKLTFTLRTNQGLFTRPNTIRHSQANACVYQAASQAILQVGFIRLLRQWTGRTAKLVSSSTKLRTPSQDLSSLDFHNTYTPNTRKYSLLCYTTPQAIPSLPVFS